MYFWQNKLVLRAKFSILNFLESLRILDRNIQGAARQRNALPQMLGYRDRYILEYIYSVTRARYKDEEKKKSLKTNKNL